MKVYNTLTGKKEELRPLQEGRISIYVCGPTTYNYIHLGNARPIVVFDTLRRYLRFRGYEVTYIQNFTDVDDKIINRAREEGCDPLELAERYIAEYFADADRLGILRADMHPRVSTHMPQIIAAVAKLVEQGFAYEIEGDVYYRVSSFANYGCLSGRSVDDMLAGARVNVDERKEAPVDFALWKAAKPGEPAWDSPWGPGRPGWHIECSVMSTHYLGATVDIHGGGADLIFPHHENEIAQSEALTGCTFVRYWMHNGFITVNSEKMSKSLGNFFILRDILAKFPPDVVRYYLLATHYRSPLDFDDGKLEEARKALGRLKNTLYLGAEWLNAPSVPAPAADQLTRKAEEYRQSFIEAMDDDCNTAMAISYLFELSRVINSAIAAPERDSAALSGALRVFRELGDVLGIFLEEANAADDDQALIEGLMALIIEMRAAARAAKDFARADAIRDGLKALGIVIEDGKEGARWKFE